MWQGFMCWSCLTLSNKLHGHIGAPLWVASPGGELLQSILLLGSWQVRTLAGPSKVLPAAQSWGAWWGCLTTSLTITHICIDAVRWFCVVAQESGKELIWLASKRHFCNWICYQPVGQPPWKNHIRQQTCSLLINARWQLDSETEAGFIHCSCFLLKVTAPTSFSDT